MEKIDWSEAGYRNGNRIFKMGLLAVACAGMICACGGGTTGTQEAQEAVQTEQPQTEATGSAEEKQTEQFQTEAAGSVDEKQTEQPQTEATESSTPEPVSLANLYEKTDMDHIYKLTNVDTNGYGIREAYLKNGYVLLVLQDYSEEGYENEGGVDHLLATGKLVLFPLAHPNEVASREMNVASGRYYLLTEGRLAAVNWDGDYIIYDSTLEEIQKGNIDCSKVLAATDEGALWAMAEDSTLIRYQDGKEVNSVQVEGTISGSFLTEYGEKTFFSMINEAGEEFLASVDLADESAEKVELLENIYTFSNGWINYESEDLWYLADIKDPLTVTAIQKPLSEDSLWNLDENYLIGKSYQKDDSENYYQNLTVFDRKNGGLCEEKKSTELAGEELLLYDYEQGIVLYGDVTPEMVPNGLYLWDLNDLSAEKPAANYNVLDYHVDQARIDAMIQNIYDQYGVTVYYDQAHLDECEGNYLLSECEDKNKLGYALIRLTECMAEYPEGFFEELKAEYFNDVVYYLAGKHENQDPDFIDDAAGTVHENGDVLVMTLDINSWWNFRRIFLHENMHMIDAVLEKAIEKLPLKHVFEYWYKEMNSPDIASLQHYNFEETEENLKGIYVPGEDPEEAWYIDIYSKSTMGEDRARIMENSLYSESDCYFESSHINQKARHLNALIREVFESVKKSEEPVFWEARTGIVDLREEFPDIFLK